MNQTKSLKLRMKSPYPYSLVLPALIVYGVLYVLPAASGFLLSFFNVKTFKISSFTFAGLENYATVLRNPYFSVAIKNTLLFSIVTTLGKVGFALALALPDEQTDRQLGRALRRMPVLFLLTAANLFRLRGTKDKFIHTEHTGAGGNAPGANTPTEP